MLRFNLSLLSLSSGEWQRINLLSLLITWLCRALLALSWKVQLEEKLEENMPPSWWCKGSDWDASVCWWFQTFCLAWNIRNKWDYVLVKCIKTALSPRLHLVWTSKGSGSKGKLSSVSPGSGKSNHLKATLREESKLKTFLHYSILGAQSFSAPNYRTFATQMPTFLNKCWKYHQKYFRASVVQGRFALLVYHLVCVFAGSKVQKIFVSLPCSLSLSSCLCVWERGNYCIIYREDHRFSACSLRNTLRKTAHFMLQLLGITSVLFECMHSLLVFVREGEQHTV